MTDEKQTLQIETSFNHRVKLLTAFRNVAPASPMASFVFFIGICRKESRRHEGCRVAAFNQRSREMTVLILHSVLPAALTDHQIFLSPVCVMQTAQVVSFYVVMLVFLLNLI